MLAFWQRAPAAPAGASLLVLASETVGEVGQSCSLLSVSMAQQCIGKSSLIMHASNQLTQQVS
jgi:hypothetical protein